MNVTESGDAGSIYVEACGAENLSILISFLRFFSGFSLTTQLLRNNVVSWFK
jgi:hypothetical protein